MFLARGHGEEGRANGEGGGEGEGGEEEEGPGRFFCSPSFFFLFESLFRAPEMET